MILHMNIRLRTLLLALVGLGFALPSAWAGGSGIRGTVTGIDGKPVVGAEIRFERIDTRDRIGHAVTDARGRFSFDNVTVGPYKITALINKVPKSFATIRTRDNKWVRVDFDFATMAKLAEAKNKKRKRYVWVAGETGTHIGGGHWEEVDSNGNTVGAEPLDKINGSALNRPGSTLLSPNGGAGGSGN